MAKLNRHEKRERRHKRIRKKISGTPERPRLCVYRSLNAFYAQIIDDSGGQSRTLVSASSIDREFVQLTGKGVESLYRTCKRLRSSLSKGLWRRV